MSFFTGSLRLGWIPGRRIASPSFVRALAWLGCALVVGWVLSHWLWQIVLSDEPIALESPPLPTFTEASTVVASRHLLGRGSSGSDMGGNSAGEINLKLLGALTSSPGKPGFAILAEEGKPSVAAIEGETFMPGVTLLQILPGKVRLKIGERETIVEIKEQPSLPQPAQEPPRSLAPQQAATPQVGNAPGGRFSRERLKP